MIDEGVIWVSYLILVRIFNSRIIKATLFKFQAFLRKDIKDGLLFAGGFVGGIVEQQTCPDGPTLLRSQMALQNLWRDKTGII